MELPRFSGRPSAGAADGPIPTETAARPAGAGSVDATRRRRRVGHTRSGTEKHRAYTRRERGPSPFRCATGGFAATSARRMKRSRGAFHGVRFTVPLGSHRARALTPSFVVGFAMQHTSSGRWLSHDPSTSAVNGWGRAHDHEYLWVAGAPAQVSAGCCNGTLTFVAVGLRTASAIVKEQRSA